MPPEKTVVVREWLRKAHQDLRASEFLLTSQPSLSEVAAFHAQQCAEKSLKAFLTFHDVRFRKIHDIEEISHQIVKIDPGLKNTVKKAKSLSPFAVEIRYPGEDEPPTLAEVKEKLQIAKEMYGEILKRLPKECLPTD
jgi:HEPN domain-containing protein